MTEEQFKRACEIYNRLKNLRVVKVEISEINKHRLMYEYRNHNGDYVGCSDWKIQPIAEILNKHDKMIREEIDEEIRKLQEEIKTL